MKNLTAPLAIFFIFSTPTAGADEPLPAVKMYDIGSINVPLQTSDELHWVLSPPPGSQTDVAAIMLRLQTYRDFDGIGGGSRPRVHVELFTHPELVLQEEQKKVTFNDGERTVVCATVKRVLWARELKPTQYCRVQIEKEEIIDHESEELVGHKLTVQLRVVFTALDIERQSYENFRKSSAESINRE